MQCFAITDVDLCLWMRSYPVWYWLCMDNKCLQVSTNDRCMEVTLKWRLSNVCLPKLTKPTVLWSVFLSPCKNWDNVVLDASVFYVFIHDFVFQRIHAFFTLGLARVSSYNPLCSTLNFLISLPFCINNSQWNTPLNCIWTENISVQLLINSLYIFFLTIE